MRGVALALTLALALPLAVLAVGSAHAAAARGGAARTAAWARGQLNAGVAVDLHDYYGLTLRFVSARGGATCAGLGAAATAGGVDRWRAFRCATRLRVAEGGMFPGVAAVTLTLRVPIADGVRPTVSGVHVTSCVGRACPVH